MGTAILGENIERARATDLFLRATELFLRATELFLRALELLCLACLFSSSPMHLCQRQWAGHCWHYIALWTCHGVLQSTWTCVVCCSQCLVAGIKIDAQPFPTVLSSS
ncbi:unnamed protein product [Discosporangium mesarthrocarpum]